MNEPEWLKTAREKGLEIKEGRTTRLRPAESRPGAVKDLPPNISEKEFMRAVIAHAELCGWLVYHTHDSRRSQKGFPDLVLVRGPHLLFVELKTDSGLLTKEQAAWLEALRRAYVSAVVWRPRMWKTIIVNSLY